MYSPKFWMISLAFGLMVFGSTGFGAKSEETKKVVESEVQIKPIRLAMTDAFVSEAGIEVYERIVKYLSDKTGLEFEFVTGFSYSTVDAMLNDGAASLGFVCGLPYVLNRERIFPTIRLVVAPIMKLSHYNDQPKYFSYVIVHEDSKFENFSDLKGCTYVYNDKISNSGYNMPRVHLIELGKIHGFFGKVLRSGSNEESIRMVALGMADASCVDSLVLDYDIVRNPEYARQVKVIEKLGPAGIPPLVASTMTDPELVKTVQKIMVEMKDDPQGRVILKEALVDRFEVVDDSNYDDIRLMKKIAEKMGFLEIK